jgi:hypothetical protein
MNGEDNYAVDLKELVLDAVTLNKMDQIMEEWCLLLNGFLGSINVR